jgi:hypothetical protein
MRIKYYDSISIFRTTHIMRQHHPVRLAKDGASTSLRKFAANFSIQIAPRAAPPFDFTSLALRYAQGTTYIAQMGKKKKSRALRALLFFFFPISCERPRSLSGT